MGLEDFLLEGEIRHCLCGHGSAPFLGSSFKPWNTGVCINRAGFGVFVPLDVISSNVTEPIFSRGVANLFLSCCFNAVGAKKNDIKRERLNRNGWAREDRKYLGYWFSFGIICV